MCDYFHSYSYLSFPQIIIIFINRLMSLLRAPNLRCHFFLSLSSPQHEYFVCYIKIHSCIMSMHWLKAYTYFFSCCWCLLTFLFICYFGIREIICSIVVIPIITVWYSRLMNVCRKYDGFWIILPFDLFFVQTVESKNLWLSTDRLQNLSTLFSINQKFCFLSLNLRTLEFDV